MAIATPGNRHIGRIVDALGLKHVRSLRLSADIGSAVAVVTEQYVTDNQLDRLAGELETKEWVLVSKDEWTEMKLLSLRPDTLSVAERWAIKRAAGVLTGVEDQSAESTSLDAVAVVTLRGMLERR